MTEPPTEKTCTKCGETKPLEEFGRQKRARDGRDSQCKECKRTYMRRYSKTDAGRSARRRWLEENDQEQKQKSRERFLDKYWSDPEFYRGRSRRYYEENREYVCARESEYRVKNREKVLEREAAYRQKNRDRIRAYFRDLHRREPQRAWRNGYSTRARQYGHPVLVEDFTKDDVIAKYGDHCAYCEAGAFESLDHYVPVKAGGPHTLENVRPSCFACNRAKSDYGPEEWLAGQAEWDALTEDEQSALIDAEIARWLPDDEGAR